MTQSAQSERAQTALKASGITGAPLMSLEREDALFVLTDDMLVYQDGGGTRRVTLRDLTRIHSDQAGLLRVETPAGTALTASLLGFDVGQVQSFFKGVRSATARAKDLPDSPTPTLGGAKTFGSAPAPETGKVEAKGSPAEATPEEAVKLEKTVPELAGMPEPSVTPDAASRLGEPTKAGAPSSLPPGAKDAEPEKSKAPEAAGVTAGATLTARPVVDGAATSKPPEARSQEAKSPEPRKTGGSAENPVVISSSSFSPNISKPGLGAGGTLDKPDTPKAEATRAEPAKPDLSKDKPPATPVDQTAARIELPNRPVPRNAVAVPGNSTPVTAQIEHSKPEIQAVADPLPTPLPVVAPPVTALSKVAAATALARQAGTVESLAGRLKVLGAVLFIGALALAFFQFTNAQPLAGIWTLLSGGVGAIALLALGELSGLLALLARTPGPVTGAASGNGHDD